MTKKERALKNLKQMCSDGRYLGSGSYAPSEILEDFNFIIKALEQEPQTDKDCIYREDAIDAIMRYLGRINRDFEAYRGTAKIILNHLPSVDPKEPKTGHWIKMPLIETGQTYSHKCSVCGRKILAIKDLSEFPYCHCGAKMESEGI